MSLSQRTLLTLSVIATIGLLALLASRKFAFEFRRNDAPLLEMIANISSGLDRLKTEFDDISTRTEVARGRLRQLAALHRENLSVCAMLLERRRSRLKRALDSRARAAESMNARFRTRRTIPVRR